MPRRKLKSEPEAPVAAPEGGAEGHAAHPDGAAGAVIAAEEFRLSTLGYAPTAAQKRALLAVALQPELAAKPRSMLLRAAKISRSSWEHWHADPRFRAWWDAACLELARAGTGKVLAALLGMVLDPRSGAGARTRAAEALLRHTGAQAQGVREAVRELLAQQRPGQVTRIVARDGELAAEVSDDGSARQHALASAPKRQVQVQEHPLDDDLPPAEAVLLPAGRGQPAPLPPPPLPAAPHRANLPGGGGSESEGDPPQATAPHAYVLPSLGGDVPPACSDAAGNRAESAPEVVPPPPGPPGAEEAAGGVLGPLRLDPLGRPYRARPKG